MRPPGWIGIALAFYAFIAIGIAEGGLGVLLPSILTAYNLTPATVTFLFLSQVSGYMVAAFSSSLLASRIGLARMLLMASVTLTSALVIYAIAPRWHIMVAAGTFLGLGIGFIDAGLNTYIANQRNANIMGLLHAFYGVGALLGPALATTLLAFGMNWRRIYLHITAIVGVTVIGMLWAVVSNYQPMAKRVIAQDTDARASLKLALRTPAVLVAGILLLVYVGTEASLGNWAYSVQSLSRGTPEVVAGYSVTAYWLGLTIGRLIMGRFVARWGAIRTMDLAIALLTIGLIAWWLLPNQLFSLPVIGFALAPIFPATIWLMPQRVSSSMVPAAIGFITSVASLGAATIPTLIGWIADWAGLEIIPVLMVPLAVVVLGLHRWLVRYTPIKSEQT
ncbi:MFS transporter [Chroogloeocystis siderophila]|jgi:fucose permease|uniref:MFS transporter n=1 Tax=Chroogloeocystis siderophila 5.2 s.c.1 TaxID=247279 RepID=A0A1U7HWW8_9CHRO|nr:MFS transporter [Chroogloeocystis siderophila]OKH28078.1 MFS transporter [Chroogloeocystis siderophila 5.2 s.c.1]